MELYVYTATLALVFLCSDPRPAQARSQSWDSDYDYTYQGVNIPQPTFQDTPQRVEVRQGLMATLPCSISNLGTKKVIWRRKSQASPLTVARKTFVKDQRIKVENTPLTDHWPLIIKEVTLDDEGQYECQVASKDRQLRRYVYLHIIRGPLISRDTPLDTEPRKYIELTGNTIVDKGQRLVLKCNASGGDEMPQDIDWFFEGNKLSADPDKSIQIHKSVQLMKRSIYSTLEIEKVDMTDAGVYVCRISPMQVNKTMVQVLNADKTNSKRGTDKGSSLDRYGRPRSRHDRLDSSTSENGSGPSSPPPGLHFLVSLACAVTLLTSLASCWQTGSMIT